MTDQTAKKWSQFKILLDGAVKEIEIVDHQHIQPACGRISDEAPLAKIIAYMDIGQSANIQLPSGKTVRIVIIDAW